MLPAMMEHARNGRRIVPWLHVRPEWECDGVLLDGKGTDHKDSTKSPSPGRVVYGGSTMSAISGIAPPLNTINLTKQGCHTRLFLFS